MNLAYEENSCICKAFLEKEIRLMYKVLTLGWPNNLWEDFLLYNITGTAELF